MHRTGILVREPSAGGNDAAFSSSAGGTAPQLVITSS